MLTYARKRAAKASRGVDVGVRRWLARRSSGRGPLLGVFRLLELEIRSTRALWGAAWVRSNEGPSAARIHGDGLCYLGWCSGEIPAATGQRSGEAGLGVIPGPETKLRWWVVGPETQRGGVAVVAQQALLRRSKARRWRWDAVVMVGEGEGAGGSRAGLNEAGR